MSKARGKWMRADHIVDQCYCDLCNGITRSEIMLKLQQGAYDGQEKGIGERTAYDYLNAALDRMHYDMEGQLEDIRADLYAKLLTVYADAMQANDRYSAIGALGTIIKLVGAAKEKTENNTNILVNADKEGITINFGFNKKEETNEN